MVVSSTYKPFFLQRHVRKTLSKTDQLPPLKALRAFEAAARHLSIKGAAEELHVTPSAVSQLVKSLEDRLDTRLFRRLNRALVLTEAGQAYLPPVHDAFRRIAKATQQTIALSDQGVLTVSVVPDFAAAWLIPRLAHLRARHPEINLRVKSTVRLANFERDGVDVAIRHGLGRYPGLHSDRILTVELLPVVAPKLLAAWKLPSGASDIAEMPLIHEAARADWRLWLEAQGADRSQTMEGPSFDDEMLRIHAAVAGLGVALVRSALVEKQLTEGQLVALPVAPWPSELAYYCVCPEQTMDRPNIAAFRDWVMEEGGRDGG